MATTALPLLHLLPRIVCAAFFACLPGLVAGIRKDIGLAAPIMCRSTVQGRHLISDDNVLPKNRVTFFLSTKETDVLKLKVARPVTSGTYRNVFDFCMGRCRHSSASVCSIVTVHENAYASDFHHCFLLQQNSSGSADSGSGPRLDGINISIGRSGESCSSVCRAKGQSCVPSRLSVLNKCEILQKYMRCKSGCFSSLGPDQPAQVVDEAPSNLNPGACLYMQMDERLTCDGSHQHTRRLT
uniref:SREBP regulating gene protein n=1 Tax=Oryza nivara TaxID=4536 RepID=A0A0E0J0L0_ORYNI